MTATMSHNPSGVTSFGPSRAADTDVTDTPSTPNDLHKLKEISEKLNLPTRRPSVVQWKQIIEYRKSRGQYVSSEEPQHLDNIVSQRIGDIGETTAPDNKQFKFIPENSFKTLFHDSADTPTKHGSASPSQAMVPTPIRRQRRIAQIVIPELDTPDSSDQESTNEEVTKLQKSNVSSFKNTPHTSGDMNTLKAQNKGPGVKEECLTARYRQISQSFEEIRRDLVIMRIEDNKLARKLLDVRSEMLLMKAQYSCDEHALMLDDIAFEMEEEEQLTGLIKACDLSNNQSPFMFTQFSPLRHIGVSKMNLNIRRFSIR